MGIAVTLSLDAQFSEGSASAALHLLTCQELDERGAVRMLDADAWQERRRRLKQLGGPPMR